MRAPIHNPYDKFTGNDFNAWIGDLTSKIRRVLAHEEPLVEQVPLSSSAGDVSAYEDGPMEDSFAEVKARRAAKGKGRADPGEVQDEEVVESIVVSDDHEEHELQEVYESDEEDYSDEEVSMQKGLPETIELSSDEDEEPTAHRLSSPGIEDEEGESADEEDFHREPFDIADDDDELQPETDEVEDGQYDSDVLSSLCLREVYRFPPSYSAVQCGARKHSRSMGRTKHVRRRLLLRR